MSRVEDKALKKYPMKFVGYCKDSSDATPIPIDANEKLREAYVEGYHQAEKDNELSWEDLKLLQDISHEVFAEVAKESVDYYQIYPTQQSFLEEVLKRFKAQKGEEYDRQSKENP